MKILLINSNQVVQKLVEITTKKIECEFLSLTSLSDLKLLKELNTYHLIVIDDESLRGGEKEFFSLCPKAKSILLYSQYEGDVTLFSHAIKKPFLPNEFLKVLLNFKQALQDQKKPNQKDEESKTDEKELLADVDHHNEDEDFEQLLKELKIGENLDGLDKQLGKQEEDLSEIMAQKNGEMEEMPATSTIREEELLSQIPDLEKISQDIEELQEESPLYERGVLDIDEIQKVQELLQQTQDTPFKQRDLKILEAIFNQPAEKIQKTLEGMEVNINITFGKKE